MGAPRPLDSDIYQCRKKTQVTGNRKQVNLRHSHYPSLVILILDKPENSSHFQSFLVYWVTESKLFYQTAHLLFVFDLQFFICHLYKRLLTSNCPR